MKEILIAIFGVYEPLVDPVSGSYVYGVAGVDWPYVLGVLLFGVVLYCFLRLVGVWLKQ